MLDDTNDLKTCPQLLPSLCRSGHLTEDPATDAPPLDLIQSLRSPSLLAPTRAHQAGPDPVPGPDPKADRGILSFFQVLSRFSVCLFIYSSFYLKIVPEGSDIYCVALTLWCSPELHKSHATDSGFLRLILILAYQAKVILFYIRSFQTHTELDMLQLNNQLVSALWWANCVIVTF